ncbi:MAG: hypothetical protein H7839_11260 [Magnetococcus sp. YQC-5]
MEISDLIANRMQAKEKLFVSKTEFYKLLGAALCRQLGVTPQSTTESLATALRTHCQDRFRLAQGGRSQYVAFNLPDETFLLEKAKRLTSFTVAQLALNLPMSKVRVPPALTLLLERGEVVCIAIKKDFSPIFQWSKATQSKGAMPSGVPSASLSALASANPSASSAGGVTDEFAFKQAFKELGQGRNFVPIHRLRASLGWEKRRFDQLVWHLKAKEHILLNMGDPTRLTPDEIRNSLQDDNGMLYITLNWLESLS